MTILSAALLLLLVMDPFGNLPFFISALKPVPKKRHTRIIFRELLIALAFLVVFLFGGEYLLAGLGISEPALSVAGGIVLFLIAVKMIFPPPKGAREEESTGEPFIVPLAVPYVAGPSALASVLLIMNQDPSRSMEWLIALLIAWACTGLVLLLSGFFSRILGHKGLVAIERLMGMVLVAIATQMVMTGVRTFMQTG